MNLTKKICTVLLLLAVCLGIVVACNDGDGSDETTASTTAEQTSAEQTTTAEETTDAATTTEETEPPVPKDDTLYGWFDQGTVLNYRDGFEKGDKNAIAISMAKNEMEGFQYILTSDVDYKGLRCEVSTLTDG
ncbi:MAG: hypothetical protein IJD10_07485, partial [Clostridia bacterium]|nr:hypothetical protein [Clostridia bacterium]